MSIHATVNTNASSSLNTQKLINSYTGGVQPRVINVTYASAGDILTKADQGVATFTVADSSPLDEVSHILLNFTNSQIAKATLKNDNTQGILLTLNGAGLSRFSAAADLAKFKEVFDRKYNVWECSNIRYSATGDSEILGTFADKGADRLNTSSLVVVTSNPGGAGDTNQIAFQLRKVTSGTSSKPPSIISILLSRRRRTEPTPADAAP